MEDGEWYGYFTSGTSRSDLGSPMSNIRFVFDENLSVMDNLKFRAANCVDEHGTFALEGRVWADATRECGQIFFRQQRQGTTSFQYFGTMTPLGISGYWGGRSTSIGMFWLWKREWTEMDGDI
ncbi:hypothetical protein GQ53DRAFT_753266 [Thozetella sp. PMI_491]|nr:hypothetical protein GQ53DRAFT_753266 [Thozetella sp. PMI_491]